MISSTIESCASTSDGLLGEMHAAKHQPAALRLGRDPGKSCRSVRQNCCRDANYGATARSHDTSDTAATGRSNESTSRPLTSFLPKRSDFSMQPAQKRCRHSMTVVQLRIMPLSVRRRIVSAEKQSSTLHRQTRHVSSELTVRIGTAVLRRSVIAVRTLRFSSNVDMRWCTSSSRSTSYL